MLPIKFVWPLFTLLMGFAIGGSVVWGLDGLNATVQQVHAAKEHQTSNHETKTEKEKTEDVLAYYTLWLMVFTGALAVATIGLGVATGGLYLTGEKQIELVRDNATAQAADMKASIKVATDANEHSHTVFVATQRPWLAAAKIEPIGRVSFENGLRIPFELTIKNGGFTPATDVNWSCSCWLRSMGGSPRDMQATFAAELIRDRHLRVEMNSGHLVMPNGELRTGVVSQMYDMLPDDAGGFSVIITGCLDYRFPGEGSFHQTGFTFHLTRKRTDGNIGDFGPARTVFHPGVAFQADTLVFEPFPSGFFAT